MSLEPDTDNVTTCSSDWIVARPPDVLNQLPVEMKWEFTRRHPYYLRWWKMVADHAANPNADPAERERAEAARLLLLLIGVTHTPLPPGASFGEMNDGDLATLWRSGAVAPAIMRTLVAVLLRCLPTSVCGEVGQVLLKYAYQEGPTPLESLLTALQDLNSLMHPALDQFPDAPFVSVNVEAPKRAIDEAMDALVRQFKERRSIPERRRHDELFPDYLEVWDLREGWAGESYECGRERTLRQIAADLKVPLGTVANRYRRAFFFLTGHEYSAELWARLVGAFKLRQLLPTEELPTVVGRRPRITRSPRPVPASRLSGPEPYVIDQIVSPDILATDLETDIIHLIAAGRTNSQIAQELDLKTTLKEQLIDYFRGRVAEKI